MTSIASAPSAAAPVPAIGFFVTALASTGIVIAAIVALAEPAEPAPANASVQLLKNINR